MVTSRVVLSKRHAGDTVRDDDKEETRSWGLLELGLARPERSTTAAKRDARWELLELSSAGLREAWRTGVRGGGHC